MSPRLFDPVTLGTLTLPHRIVFAPMTRLRVDPATTAISPLAREYYAQRAHTPGTLLVTESVLVAPQAAGFPGPGIWSDAHVQAWKAVVDAVHDKGGVIALQIAALAGVASPSALTSRGFEYVGASDASAVNPSGPHPRQLTTAEIGEWVGFYAAAARRGVEGAGFDVVEVHAANGDATDEFLSSNWNKRTDEYGGSAVNRVRFVVEVVEAVVAAVGASRVGLRISPWSPYQNMRMPDADIVDTYTALVRALRARVPGLAYLHVVQPRISAADDTDVGTPGETDAFVRALWAEGRTDGEGGGGGAYIAAGGFTRESALRRAEESGDLVAFGRHFVSNPDLVKKLEKDVPLTAYDRATFYTPGPEGYVDYPVTVTE